MKNYYIPVQSKIIDILRPGGPGGPGGPYGPGRVAK